MAIGVNSHAEGDSTQARGETSHVEGRSTVAKGDFAHAEGNGSTANGIASHAENNGRAYGHYSHAEGGSTARGDHAHAEGSSIADGDYSHAEGGIATASAYASHAEGNNTKASAYASHTEGMYTVANGEYMHAQGQFNKPDDTVWPDWVANTAYSIGDQVTYIGIGYTCKTANSDAEFTYGNWKRESSNGGENAFVIGNGTSDTERSNAAAIGWDGTGKYAGDVYANYNFATKTGEKLATESFVRELIQQYLGG